MTRCFIFLLALRYDVLFSISLGSGCDIVLWHDISCFTNTVDNIIGPNSDKVEVITGPNIEGGSRKCLLVPPLMRSKYVSK